MKIKLTKADREEIKTILIDIRKVKRSQYYVSNTKTYRRYKMERRAKNIARKKLSKKEKEMMSMRKDAINKRAIAYAKKVKIEVHDGELVFINPKGE